ncbi:hypothetical protein DFH11DRAFT_1516201 [Phellopilus nigrolimitatus]|nr:hypothetical protein DFH11DRAFT_1516201 [Phellopilus nigrolimitatus]
MVTCAEDSHPEANSIKERIASDISRHQARQMSKYHSKRGAKKIGRPKGSKAKQDLWVKVEITRRSEQKVIRWQSTRAPAPEKIPRDPARPGKREHLPTLNKHSNPKFDAGKTRMRRRRKFFGLERGCKSMQIQRSDNVVTPTTGWQHACNAQQACQAD